MPVPTVMELINVIKYFFENIFFILNEVNAIKVIKDQLTDPMIGMLIDLFGYLKQVIGGYALLFNFIFLPEVITSFKTGMLCLEPVITDFNEIRIIFKL